MWDLNGPSVQQRPIVINVGHINRASLECKFQFPKPHFSTSFAALALFCPNDDNDLENQNLIPSHLLTRDTERKSRCTLSLCHFPDFSNSKISVFLTNETGKTLSYFACLPINEWKRDTNKKMHKQCRKKARAGYINGISIKMTDWIYRSFFIDSDSHSCNYLSSKIFSSVTGFSEKQTTKSNLNFSG